MSDARVDGLIGRWLMNYIRVYAGGITLETGGTGESGFDPVELRVMGPPCGLKAGSVLTFCTVVIARRS